MQWIWIIGFTIFTAAWAEAKTQVKLEGTIKGYFLAHNGTLKVYEVPFSFPDKPSSSEFHERLFVLWAGYYLKAQLSSGKPFQSVWLLAGNGRLLWRRHYPEGITEGTIPYQEGGWIGIKGQDGLSVRLLVRFVDGSEMLIRPHFPVRFERILPLKVDWLDFIRIAEVAHLLKVKGKEIWEGFSLDGIPFLLEGDEGQWVLVNHPKPPKGFVRYEGPLPKVPLAITVHWGEKMNEGERREEVGGWVEKINEVWTAALRYFPDWWVLRDCISSGYTIARQTDALQRLESITHEAFHVWWFQRLKAPKMLSKKSVRNPLMETEERECLIRALLASNTRELRQWTKSFLVARQKRRQKQGMKKEQIRDEQLEEKIEGLATFVAWQALKFGAKGDYKPLPAMKIDETFDGYRDKNERVLLETLKLTRRALGHTHSLGLAQIFLLERLCQGWRQKVNKESSLEELLLREVASASLPKGFFDRQESGNEPTQWRTEETKHPKQFTIIWLPLPKPLIEEVKQLKANFGEPLPEIEFETDLFNALLEEPAWVVMDERNNRLGILWDKGKQLALLKHPNGNVTLQGEGLKIWGKFDLNWDSKGVHIHPLEEPKKGGVSTMLRRRNLTLVLLPVLLCSGNWMGSAQVVTGITGDLSGVFHSAIGGFAYETLPLAGNTPDGAERYFVTDETYTGQITVWHADAEPFRLTFWIFITWTQIFGGGNYWTVTGAVTAANGGTLLAFAASLSPDSQQQERKKLRIKFRYRDSKGREHEIEVEYETVKTPPTGSVTIYGSMFDLETQEAKPISVSGNIWRKAEPNKKYGFYIPQSGQGAVRLAPAPDYTAEATSRTPMYGLCEPPMKSSPEEFAVGAHTATSIGFLFIRHQGIRGRVMEQTLNGRLPLKDAIIYVLKDGEELPTRDPIKSGFDGRFEVPAHYIDAWLKTYGDSKFTIKVVPPPRSQMMPKPSSILKDTPVITKCKRRKTEESCPRDTAIDLGDFVFTYEPPPSGPGEG